MNRINIKGCFYYLIKTFQNWREWSKPSLNVRPDDLIEIETTLILLMEFVAWNLFITRSHEKKKMAGVAGLEPVTSAVTGQRSNQLSYTPAKGKETIKKNCPGVKFCLVKF